MLGVKRSILTKMRGRASWKSAIHIMEIGILLIMNLMQLHCLNTRVPNLHNP